MTREELEKAVVEAAVRRRRAALDVRAAWEPWYYAGGWPPTEDRRRVVEWYETMMRAEDVAVDALRAALDAARAAGGDAT